MVIFSVSTTKAFGLYYKQVNSSSNLASTTSVFIIGGTGTTTKTFASDGYQQLTHFIALASSSTPPTLCWTNQYSNDGTDWYTQDNNYASTSAGTSDTVHASSQYKECWTYATTSSSHVMSYGTDGKTIYIGRKIVVPNLDSVFTRTVFSIDPGVRARLDIRSVLKNEIIVQK